MADFGVETLGFAELEQQLDALKNSIVRRALREGLTKAGAVLVQEQKARAPVLKEATKKRVPEELRDSIGADIKISNANEQAELVVGPHKRAFWARFAEFGTSHQAAAPFIGPAFDASSEQALEAFMGEIGAAIDEATKK